MSLVIDLSKPFGIDVSEEQVAIWRETMSDDEWIKAIYESRSAKKSNSESKAE